MEVTKKKEKKKNDRLFIQLLLDVQHIYQTQSTEIGTRVDNKTMKMNQKSPHPNSTSLSLSLSLSNQSPVIII